MLRNAGQLLPKDMNDIPETITLEPQNYKYCATVLILYDYTVHHNIKKNVKKNKRN